eukprot:8064938-Pyramimonas_sp.AAC.1
MDLASSEAPPSAHMSTRHRYSSGETPRVEDPVAPRPPPCASRARHADRGRLARRPASGRRCE